MQGLIQAARRWGPVAVGIGVVLGVLNLIPSGVRADQGQWNFGVELGFRTYCHDRQPKVASATNVALSGNVGVLRIGAQARVSGASCGIPSHGLILEPQNEWVERWSISLQSPAGSLELGNTYIPAMSRVYLAGRSLYGCVGSTWGSFRSIAATATGFCGTNASSSGLNMVAYDIKGGSIDASIGKRIGLSLRGLSARREGFDVDMGGVQIWASVGSAEIAGELVGSQDNYSQGAGYAVLFDVGTPAFGGKLALSGQYASDDFASPNVAAMSRAGGKAQSSISWSGDVLQTSDGNRVHLDLSGTLAVDNMGGLSPAQDIEQSAEAGLTLISQHSRLVTGRYRVAHRKSEDGPIPSQSKTEQVASIEATFPVRLGQGTVDVGARGRRSVDIDHLGRSQDILSILAVSGATNIGKTRYGAKLGWSRSIQDTTGAEKRNLETAISLSRSIPQASLDVGLDASRIRFERICTEGEEGSAGDAVKAGAWLRCKPAAWVEALVAAKSAWVRNKGLETGSYASDSWLEGRVKLRF